MTVDQKANWKAAWMAAQMVGRSAVLTVAYSAVKKADHWVAWKVG